LWKRQRIALFLRAGGPLYESTQSAQIRFRYFDIFRDLEKYFAELQSWQPTVLVGPPSVLLLLAQAKKSGQLHIEPARVIAVAEVLDDHDRIALEEVFGGPIHQLYQATEGCLASTCAYGTLHMHEDVVRVEKEWIDEEQGRFVPIITDFQRKTQPIVRYRLDDVLVERRRPCPCGSVFTALDRIEGRCDELLWLPAVNGQGLRHIFPDFVRRALLGSSVLLREYRLRQLSPHSIRLELDCLPEHRAAVALGARAALNALFRRQGLIEAEIEVAPWSPEAPGAKSRRIQGLRRN
jgi:putative adenylate-forming enzyme